MKNIALDPGFDSFKAAEAQPDGIYLEVSIPSVVGIGTTDLGLLDVGDVGGKKAKRNKPLTITFARSEYLVGQHISDYARPIERLDFNRLTDTPELRALTMPHSTKSWTAARTKHPSSSACPSKCSNPMMRPRQSKHCRVGW